MKFYKTSYNSALNASTNTIHINVTVPTIFSYTDNYNPAMCCDVHAILAITERGPKK